MATTAQPIEVHKVPIESVSDASGLARLIDDGAIEADRVETTFHDHGAPAWLATVRRA